MIRVPCPTITTWTCLILIDNVTMPTITTWTCLILIDNITMPTITTWTCLILIDNVTMPTITTWTCLISNECYSVSTQHTDLNDMVTLSNNNKLNVFDLNDKVTKTNRFWFISLYTNCETIFTAYTNHSWCIGVCARIVILWEKTGTPVCIELGSTRWETNALPYCQSEIIR